MQDPVPLYPAGFFDILCFGTVGIHSGCTTLLDQRQSGLRRIGVDQVLFALVKAQIFDALTCIVLCYRSFLIHKSCGTVQALRIICVFRIYIQATGQGRLTTGDLRKDLQVCGIQGVS